MTGDADRIALVIGSQCDSLGPANHLPGLEELTEQLHGLLVDPWRGDCRPAVESAPLVNPSVEHLGDAVREAVATADAQRAVLVLCFIGHGDIGQEFHLFAKDSVEASLHGPPGPPPFSLIRELAKWMRQAPGLAGVLVVLDTCRSGAAAAQAAADWSARAEELHRHFEVLASTDDRPAWSLSFTRFLVNAVRRGHIAYEPQLRAVDLRDLILADLRGLSDGQPARLQPPTLTSHHGGRQSRDLWVAKNAAHSLQTGSLLAGSKSFTALRRSFRYFQATQEAAEVITAIQAHPFVALRGDPGSGKSTLVAALARPEVAPGLIPEGMLHGYYALGDAETPDVIARRLSEQLRYTVDGFADTLRERAEAAEATNTKVDSVAALTGALDMISRERTVRIAFDGIDHLSGGSTRGVARLVSKLTAPGSGVNVVIAARPHTTLPPGFHQVRLAAASAQSIADYLRQRTVPARWHPVILERAAGSWLFASRLVERTLDPDFRDQPAEALPRDLPGAFDADITRALDGAAWNDPDAHVRTTLTVLAATGPGAVLPLPLFRHACAGLGTSARDADDAIARLASLVLTGDGARLGIFHQTLIDHLYADTTYRVDRVAGHAALADAISALAPRSRHERSDPLHQYAEIHEPEHLWQCGRAEDVLDVVEARRAPAHRDNLNRWLEWEHQLADKFGPHARITLLARRQIARWTGECGERQAARDKFHQLWDDCSQLLERTDRLTIEALHGFARWTGECGYYAEARDLFGRLLHPASRHYDYLAVLGDYAAWVGQCGDPDTAMTMNRDLLRQKTQALGVGPDHEALLGTRGGLAYWTWQAGHLEEALAQAQILLQDRSRLSGPEHRDTLSWRHNIAQMIGEAGEPAEALRLSRELLPDRTRIMGARHPYTLNTKAAIAHWGALLGDPAGALDIYHEVLAEQSIALIEDHRDALLTREGIAHCQWLLGAVDQTLDDLQDLLQRRTRMLGNAHPHTRRTRRWISNLRSGQPITW